MQVIWRDAALLQERLLHVRGRTQMVRIAERAALRLEYLQEGRGQAQVARPAQRCAALHAHAEDITSESEHRLLIRRQRNPLCAKKILFLVKLDMCRVWVAPS